MFLRGFFKRTIKKINQINENPILTSFIVLILTGIVVITLSLPYYLKQFDNFYPQVLAEAHGMLFDITIIGILIFWLNKIGEKNLRIRMYLDEIDDFRLWKSEEAAFRTAGNIKRLNRHKIHKLNLVECHLVRTNMSDVNLSESNLNLADISNSQLFNANLEEARLNQTSFVNSNLNHANFKNAYASGANFQQATLIRCNFENTSLILANFSDAILMEANLKGADVSGADFTNCNLFKADLRNVSGLKVEQMKSVSNLYKTKFDPHFLDELKSFYPKLLEKETLSPAK